MIVIGTIIEVKEKETSTGKKYKNIIIMKENSTETEQFNVFENNFDLEKIIIGRSYVFDLVENGNYLNVQKIQDVPSGTQVTLNDAQQEVINNLDKAPKTNISKQKTIYTNSYFKKLYNIQCETDKKGNFTYISWAEAWTKLKLLYPTATSKIYENEDGLPYFKVLNNVMVKVGVTVEGIEHISWYPVMDNYNKAVPIDKVDVFILNKSLQRAFAKAIALHGLGLYVFKGEDLPDDN